MAGLYQGNPLQIFITNKDFAMRKMRGPYTAGKPRAAGDCCAFYSRSIVCFAVSFTGGGLTTSPRVFRGSGNTFEGMR